MDDYWQIGFLILCVAALLGVAYLIPTLLQMRRTTQDLARTLETLNQSLPAILRNIEDISTNLRHTTASARTQIDGLALSVKRLQSVLMGIAAGGEQALPSLTRSPYLHALRQAVALGRAAREFLRVYRSLR